MLPIEPEKINLSLKICSSIAAIFISLACGTNYVYSAWGPQFADKLNLTSTEQNLLGISGNLGMYLLGIPIGIFIDQRGARIPLISGGVLLGIGYLMLYRSYTTGSGYLPLLCLFSFFTGYGGCASFAAAIKVSALNWPEHRGSATAFPAGAFGLSAFLFSSIAEFLVPGDTANLLLLLTIGTFGSVIIGSFFLRVVNPSKISDTPLTAEDFSHASQLKRIKSQESLAAPAETSLDQYTEPIVPLDHERSSLLARSSPLGSDITSEDSIMMSTTQERKLGSQLLKSTKFWQLFMLMGILSGIALMTINNIGNNVRALWRQWDESRNEEFIIRQEAIQVSTISICSFLARIISGIGSDFIVKTFNASRLWFLNLSCILYFTAQILALSIRDPRLLYLVSSLTGVSYGCLYGIYPSLIAETFGVGALSQNLGAMLLGPILSGNVFNLFYGKIYDQHSIEAPNGHRVCTEGLSCYREAYFLTTFACLLGLGINLWSIHYTHRLKLQNNRWKNHDVFQSSSRLNS